jgi:hypothetical protein
VLDGPAGDDASYQRANERIARLAVARDPGAVALVLLDPASGTKVGGTGAFAAAWAGRVVTLDLGALRAR